MCLVYHGSLSMVTRHFSGWQFSYGREKCQLQMNYTQISLDVKLWVIKSI